MRSGIINAYKRDSSDLVHRLNANAADADQHPGANAAHLNGIPSRALFPTRRNLLHALRTATSR